MERVAHANGQGGLVDTVRYTRDDIETFAKYAEAKLASG